MNNGERIEERYIDREGKSEEKKITVHNGGDGGEG